MINILNRLNLVLLERSNIRAIVLFVSIGISLYLAAVLWFGWWDIVTAFATLGLQTIWVGLIVSSSSYLWRFARWDYSLRYFENAIPKLAHLGVYFSGLALTATPGKVGETFRSALLLHYGVPVRHSLAAFLSDRGSDVLGMIFIGALASFTLGHQFSWVWLLAFVIVLLGSISFARILLFPYASAGWCRLESSISWLPIKGGQATLEAWSRIWSLPRILAFTFIAVFAYGTQALVFWWFCSVLGTGISLTDCVLIFVQATLFGAATMIPGGLGAMEAALVFQLLERDVSESTAISLAISIRLVTLWFGMLLGVFAMLLTSYFNTKHSPKLVDIGLPP
jgi:uncharacterized membrane protein YbhN (UPF0104 family)